MDRLPVELLVVIFSWLEPQDLNTVSQVCKAWRRCCADTTWKTHFRNKFGNTTTFSRLTGGKMVWQAEVIARYQALEKWSRGKLPAISYKAPCGPVGDSAVNWDFKMLFASSYTTGHYSITHLSTGAFHRRSKRAQLGPDHEELPSAIKATKFGVVTGYYSGTIIYTTMGEEALVLHRHPTKIDAVWLSEEASPARSPHVSIVVASGNELLFYSQLKQTKSVLLDFGEQPVAPGTGPGSGSGSGSDLVRSIHPLNNGFLIQTEKSLYHVSQDSSKHIVDTYAREIHVCYPHVLLVGDTLRRYHLESGEFFTFTDSAPTAYAFDNNIVVAYSDETVTAWPIAGQTPLWRNNEIGMEIKSMQLNAVVVVGGGFKGEFVVLNVLTGEPLPVKPMRFPSRRQWEVPRQDVFPSVSQIHISSQNEPVMVLIMDQTVMVYGIAEDPKKKPKGPLLKRNIEPMENIEDIELYNDYQVRRINRENLLPFSNSAQQEQLETALALSQSSQGDSQCGGLSEHDQIELALANSMAENMSEEEQMRLAMQMSVAGEGSAQPPDSDDEELRRALNASMVDQ